MFNSKLGMFTRRNTGDEISVTNIVDPDEWNCQSQSFVVWSGLDEPRASIPDPV